MKTVGYGVLFGASFVMVALLIAFIYVWLFPAGGDSWDAVYFFTHPAFYVLFGTGFAVGCVISRRRRSTSH